MPWWAKWPSSRSLSKHVRDPARAQDLARGQQAPVRLGAELVVELEQLDPVYPQPCEARLQGAPDVPFQIVKAGGIDADLGGDAGPRRDLRQEQAERALALALAVVGGGVDPVAAGPDGALEGGEAGLLGRVDQDAADDAAAQGEFRDLEAGPAEAAVAHGDGSS